MIFKEDCFKAKRFLITGASSGLGAEIAHTLNAFGAEVVAIARDIKKLQSKKNMAKDSKNFHIISKDISKLYKLDKWALNLAKEYGSFDGAVLSAGIQQTAPITSVLSVENASHTFNINYFGNLQILKGLLDKRAKSNIGASFIWISSNASIKAYKGLSNYAASKASINASIKSIALEIAPKYRINAISPGFVLTEMIESWSSVYDKDYIAQMNKSYPLGIGKAKDITPLIIFLLSKDSAWITGQNIVIDGGGSL